MVKHRHVWLVLLTLIALMDSGCASEVVPSSGPRPPADPAQVKFYEKEPRRYEILGSIEVPIGGDVRWDKRGEANAGMERLKSQAAQRGANGVLLKGDDPQMLNVGVSYKGSFYHVPIRSGTPDAAVAKAIYVLDE